MIHEVFQMYLLLKETVKAKPWQFYSLGTSGRFKKNSSTDHTVELECFNISSGCLAGIPKFSSRAYISPQTPLPSSSNADASVTTNLIRLSSSPSLPNAWAPSITREIQTWDLLLALLIMSSAISGPTYWQNFSFANSHYALG